MATTSNPTQAIEHHDVVILGAGFGGLGMAAQLAREGLHDFVVIEKNDDIGGVWLDNDYPGAACDTEAHLYCYGFHPNLRASAIYVGRDELLAYMRSLVESYDLRERIRLGVELRQARWDRASCRWHFRLGDGSQLSSRFFVPAWGQLNRPQLPAFEGLETFAGEHFHSARWRHDVALRGRRVVSVGNAASAVQYVPEIAPVVERLTVLQRSANWIVPRNQAAFSEAERDAYERDPARFEESRRALHAFRESVFERTRLGTEAQRTGRQQSLEHLQRQVADPVLRQKLTPDYEFGCKRILRSDDYYPALCRSNVALETTPIQRFVPRGVELRDGRLIEADVVIFGTGFQSQAFQGDLEIEGLGSPLRQAWADGARAYLGMSVPDFPNLFILYGPNTNLNHNSIITMLEAQQRYVIEAVRGMRHQGIEAMQVRHAVFQHFNDKLQEAMKASAFSADCSSWYKDARGRVVNNWSGAVDAYTAAARWRESDFERVDHGR